MIIITDSVNARNVLNLAIKSSAVQVVMSSHFVRDDIDMSAVVVTRNPGNNLGYSYLGTDRNHNELMFNIIDNTILGFVNGDQRFTLLIGNVTWDTRDISVID